MRKFPNFRQPDSMDCGPVCLKIISEYYGKRISLDILRADSSLGISGVSLLGISKAAENIGFKSKGGRITIYQLVKLANFPCIIHWKQDHFVVLYKVDKKYFYISDPGLGLLKYNLKEFLDGWISSISKNEEKGIVLLLEPTSKFFDLENENITTNKTKFLFSYLKKYNHYWVQLLIGLAVTSILQLIFPFLTQSIVDIGIADRNIHFIWLVLLGQLMLIIGKSSIDFVRRRVLLHISTRVNISLISDFFVKLMKLPMSFFDIKHLGDLLQRIEDHNRVDKFLTAQSLSFFFSLFSIVVFGIVLFIYSIKIFLVFIIGSLIYGLWISIFLKKRKILEYKEFEQNGINRNKVYQLINGMQEIKLQGCEQRRRWDWEDTQADLFEVKLKTLSLEQTQEAGSILINEIKNLLIVIIAATSVIYGEITLGMMLAIQYIIGQLNSPVEQIMNFIYQLQDVSISLDRMSEIHSKEEECTNKKINKLANLDNDIKFTNVNFQYEGSSKEILKNINITIPSGKVTAIVGASGSGKTTLIKLILGNYTPTEGSIFIGNIDYTLFSIIWWRSQCGAVMQDGYIFSESIANNIAISDENINQSRLKEVVKITNLDKFIEQLPLRYNTIIGQDGQGLSQGQKQRLLIARAIYKNPQFIFLDEATNALDANNEKDILINLNEYYKGKTVIVVAHRLSTVKNADQIIVMNEGEVQEIGDHYSLTKSKGLYYELVKNQLELGT